MIWNWEQPGWPGFSYRRDELRPFEEEFLKGSGLLLGAFRHLDEDGRALVRIDVLSEEALRTSEIEGEYLNRDSIQSSIRRHFGLQTDGLGVPAAEQGIAQMMIDVYETWAEPLSHEVMWRWQEMIAAGRTDLEDVGRYRRHADPMRVVSGAASSSIRAMGSESADMSGSGGAAALGALTFSFSSSGEGAEGSAVSSSCVSSSGMLFIPLGSG